MDTFNLSYTDQCKVKFLCNNCFHLDSKSRKNLLLSEVKEEVAITQISCISSVHYYSVVGSNRRFSNMLGCSICLFQIEMQCTLKVVDI